jgi:predicted signal transduction protein with EAL and GGDEF domain
VVRWGGEEFLIVAQGIAREEVAALAERVRRRVQDHAFTLPAGGALSATCSLGFALFPFDPERHLALSWREVLTVADRALYLAKRHGRNRCFGIHADPAQAAPVGTDLLRLMADDAPDLDGLVRFETQPPLAVAVEN